MEHFELKSRNVYLEKKVQEYEEKIKSLEAQLSLSKVDLSVGNKRELLTSDRTSELLASAADTAVVSVCLSSKSFDLPSAEVAATKLKAWENISIADFSDIIAGRHETEALAVLKTLCSALNPKTLKALDLSENALGEKGIRALEECLRSYVNLEEISFYNNGLSELSLRLLGDMLPPSLKKLHFHNNMSGDGGATAIANFLPKATALENFRMSSSRVSSVGGCALIKALQQTVTLKELSLEDSTLKEDGGKALAQLLPRLPKLEKLSLRDCGIDESVTLVLDALLDATTTPHLECLDLSLLEIGNETDNAVKIGKIALTKRYLNSLILQENELESAGAIKLVKGLRTGKPQNLNTLDLKSNQMGRIGATAVVQFGVDFKLKVIEIDDNQISQDGLDKIAELTQGQKLCLGSLDENEPDMDEDEDEDDEELMREHALLHEGKEMTEGELDQVLDMLNSHLHL